MNANIRLFGFIMSLSPIAIAVSARAETYRIPEAPPTAFSDIELIVNKELPDALSKAQCGGWNREQSVGRTSGPGSSISRVEGVPGRDGIPLQNDGTPWPSGMALRAEEEPDGGFSFPDSAKGLSTACEPGLNEGAVVERMVWRDPDGEGPGKYEVEMKTVPSFDDPPCALPGEEGDGAAPSCAGFCAWLNGEEYTYDDCKIFCRLHDDEENGDDRGEKDNDGDDGDGDDEENGGFRCKERALKYVCSEEWVTPPFETQVQGYCFPRSYSSTSSSNNEDGDNEEVEEEAEDDEEEENLWIWDTETPAPIELLNPTGRPQSLLPSRRVALVAQVSKQDDVEQWGEKTSDDEESPENDEQLKIGDAENMTNLELAGNCIPCAGSECRCQGPGCIELPERGGRMDPAPTPHRGKKIFRSFFRSYIASTKRDAVHGTTVKGNDLLSSTKMDVACYGFYKEFDPKESETTSRDRRCVIGFPFTREILRDDQSAVGDIGPPAPIYDPPPLSTEELEGDAWHSIAGGMSFAREKAIEKSDMDLTQLLLKPDMKTVQAIEQRLPNLSYAMESESRATDDAVSNKNWERLNGEEREDDDEDYEDKKNEAARPVTMWIQRLQQDMTRLLTPPTARLRIPAAWASSPATGDPEDEMTSSVDRELHAGDDILGEVFAIARRYLTLQEEPIPAVIPLGAPQEFRARQSQWKTYKKNRNDLGMPVPAAVDDLIAKLGDYAAQIEKYRALRGHLAETAAGLLGRRGNETAVLVEWMEENMEKYKAYLEENARRLELAPLVHAAQREITRFSDEVNMPWCRVDLLTVPIYSLLDPWYPGRPGLSPTISCDPSGDALPILCVPQERDYVFDLSRFSASDKAVLRIPVLHPVQVKLDLERLTPPALLGDAPDEQAIRLPDLPPVPEMDNALSQQAADVSVKDAPPIIETPPPIDLEKPRAALIRAAQILKNRNAAYGKFWNSLEVPDDENPLECPAWDGGRCVHVEMDLKERLMRITAQPGVLLREQLAIQGARRYALDDDSDDSGSGFAAACDARDHVCPLEPHIQSYPPPTGWQIVPQSGTADDNGIFDELRSRMRMNTVANDASLKDDGDGPVPYGMPAEQILRIFDVPRDVNLVPPTKEP